MTALLILIFLLVINFLLSILITNRINTYYSESKYSLLRYLLVFLGVFVLLLVVTFFILVSTVRFER